MNSLPPNQWNQADFQELERIIAQAKDYVVPSEQFRPQIAEAARESELHQAQLVKLRNFGLLVGGLWLIAAVVFFSSVSSVSI